jgi:predicted enzyme related to lactoylglutathione lyase
VFTLLHGQQHQILRDPADNIDRAKHFYQSLLGWKIKPTRTLMDPSSAAALQYQDISTGLAQEGTMNRGGMYKRQMKENIKNFVLVEDFDKVLAKVEKMGGKILMPRTEINGVGLVAIIQDTEGNGIGLWKPAMKE